MSVDPSFLPALEQELEYAQRTTAGGQPPDEQYIAGIKEQIKLHKKAAVTEPAEKPAELETATSDPGLETADGPKVAKK